MKKLVAFLLSVCTCTSMFSLVACGDTSTPEDGPLTKADYKEAFTAAQTSMENQGGLGETFMSLTIASPIGYHDVGLFDTEVTENQSPLGLINALAFNYFFVQVLDNENYTLNTEPIAYSAEVEGVATGRLQLVYDGNCLVGQMYMQPNGVSATGLFSIYINYNFETNEMVGFEWLLRGVGNEGSMYYYYDGVKGYTASTMTKVSNYLDRKIEAYTHPTDAEPVFDLVTEWTATNTYVNNLVR